MKPIVKIIIFLLWALILLAGYYFYHKPISPDQFIQVGSSLYDLSASGLIILVGAGLGRKWMGNSYQNGLADLSMQAALGCGALGLIWLGLGEIGLFRWWSSAIVLLIALVLLRREILDWLRGFAGWTEIWKNSSTIGRFFLVAAALLAFNQLWIALAPPVKYDSLTYHLALPRMFAVEGRLVFLPDNPYWGHPQLAEMLYTWAITIGRPSTAAVVSWWAGIVFLTGMVGLTAQTLPAQSADLKQRSLAGAAAAAFILAGATARMMFGWAYTDLFSAWFGLSLILSVFYWLESGDSRWFLWGGVFAGLAVSTKYTAGIAAIAFFGLLWIIPGMRKPRLRTWLISGGVAILIFMPWALKNIFATGNPLFPYLLPSTWYPSERLAMANLPPDEFQLLPQVVLPVFITWTGIDSAPGPGTDLSPLLVMFALPALFAFRKNAFARFLGSSLALVWACLAIAGWRFGHLQQPRLYFVFLPVLGVLAGWGWAYMTKFKANGVRLSRIAGALAIIVLFFCTWQDFAFLLKSNAVQTVLGLQTREAYLEDNTGVYFTAMKEISKLDQENSKVLMLWEGRGLYAPISTTPDPWIDQWRAAIKETGSWQIVLADWKRQKYTHILVYTNGMNFMRESDRSLTQADWLAFDELTTSLAPAREIAGSYYLLYEIK